MNITKTFDDSIIDINDERVLITENGITLDLWLENLTDGLVGDARWRTDGMVRAGSCSKWEAERFVFCAELARRELAKVNTKTVIVERRERRWAL